MRTKELIDLVIRDYQINGKRSLDAVRSISGNLLRLLPREIPGTRDVEAYKAKRLEEGAAPATVNNELSVLRRGFRHAAKLELLERVPIIDFLRVENVRDITCSKAQFRQIVRTLEVLDPVIADMARWLGIMGWRQGEARSLTWYDAGPDRDAVTLPQARSKNRKPRPVKLGKAAREILESRWLAREGPYVFHRRGEQVRIFRGAWARACKAAGCPELRPHDLRRFFAQVATDADVPIPVQMSIAGWKTMSMHIRYCITNGKMQARGTDSVAAGIDIDDSDW